jgi:hypothetical protein
MTFVSMSKIGKFLEVSAGQQSDTFANKKKVGSVLIPAELGPIISDPKFAQAPIWHVESSGSVSHQERSGGEFEFHVVTEDLFSYICRYDPATKKTTKVIAHYDDYNFSLPAMDASTLTSLLNLSDLDTFKFIKDHAILNHASMEIVDHYISTLP